jgi:tetratricopeptide (TPR) repeat protein
MANTINNLGMTYDSQGKYDEAIELYKQSLRIKEKAFGADHINMATIIRNIGEFRELQNQIEISKM